MSAPNIDPYGTDIAMDLGRGDLLVTHSGSVGLVSGSDNCVQAAFLRLLTPVGELTYDPGFGSQLAEAQIGTKLNITGQLAALNADLQTLLADDPRFESAKVIQTQKPANAGQQDSLALGIQARLSGGEQITLSDVSDPSASDVQIPMPTDPNIDPTLTWDPTTELEFFAADPAEQSQLNDLNSVQSLADDFPPSGGV